MNNIDEVSNLKDDDFLDKANAILNTEEVSQDLPSVENTEPEEQLDNNTPQEEELSFDTPNEDINYEEEYKKLMSSVNVNGSGIKLRSSDEAIQLMQQGANYSRQLSELAPYKTAISMLKDNGISDVNQIAYLIDLHKKNPNAINKLIKDSNIDVFSIDTDQADSYVPEVHIPTEVEINFNNKLEELKNSPEGQQALVEFNSWDDESKSILVQDPNVMNILKDQMKTNVFNTIKTEINRLKTIGSIDRNMPFLQAYQLVGNSLVSKYKKPDNQEVQPNYAYQRPQEQVQSFYTQPQVNRYVPNNNYMYNNNVNDKIRATGSPRTNIKKKNPYDMDIFTKMTDDVFMKNFGNKLY